MVCFFYRPSCFRSLSCVSVSSERSFAISKERAMQTTGDILVVDDEPTIVEFIADVLTDEGYAVRTALTAADARAVIAEQRPDLVLMDLTMPGEAGGVLARELKHDALADLPVILMT